MKQVNWSIKVADKLKESGLMFHEPMVDNPEAFATHLTKLDDPFPLYRWLSTEEVAWISAYSKDYSESRFFSDAYCKTSGLDSQLFKKAAYYASDAVGRFNPSYGKLVASSYMLLSNTLDGDQTRIRPFIYQNALDGFSSGRLERYGMRWLMVGDNCKAGYPQEVKNLAGCNFERLELYMDAQIGFVITYKGIDNALASFWPEGADTLLVHQIQGVRKKKFRGSLCLGRHHSHGLNQVDFRKAIVDFISRLAHDAGFERIGIRGARNNTWTNTDDDGRPHITMERTLELYDYTALRLGFNCSRNGNWYKEIGL